jgi:hypothetical protein
MNKIAIPDGVVEDKAPKSSKDNQRKLLKGRLNNDSESTGLVQVMFPI